MKLLKEPLLHFLLPGLVIFGVHAWRQSGGAKEDTASGKRIDVNAATISRLKDGWRRQFQQTPTTDDLRGMVSPPSATPTVTFKCSNGPPPARARTSP